MAYKSEWFSKNRMDQSKSWVFLALRCGVFYSRRTKLQIFFINGNILESRLICRIGVKVLITKASDIKLSTSSQSLVRILLDSLLYIFIYISIISAIWSISRYLLTNTTYHTGSIHFLSISIISTNVREHWCRGCYNLWPCWMLYFC